MVVMVEGARLRARDDAWRIAHIVIASGAKIDAVALTAMLELAPRPHDDGVGEDLDESDDLVAANRRLRAEREGRAQGFRASPPLTLADVDTALDWSGLE